MTLGTCSSRNCIRSQIAALIIPAGILVNLFYCLQRLLKLSMWISEFLALCICRSHCAGSNRKCMDGADLCYDSNGNHPFLADWTAPGAAVLDSRYRCPMAFSNAFVLPAIIATRSLITSRVSTSSSRSEAIKSGLVCLESL